MGAAIGMTARVGLVAMLWSSAAAAAVAGAAALPALRTREQTAAMRPPAASLAAPPIPVRDVDTEIGALRSAMAEEVPGLLRANPARNATLIAYARAMLGATGHVISTPQIVLVVDRNPRAELLSMVVAMPDRPWATIGTTHVSTGQAGRKDYYITPVGVFEHTDAILDFRAEGTYNEHHVRGLGMTGMRVWDFGWQWALKGWHADGEGGDIRLQMHATDPLLLEPRLGRPASEGCIRLSSAANRFLDRHGVMDADYERASVANPSIRQLLRADRVPSSLAGRYLIVVDTSLPAAIAPTAASRPPGWPEPPSMAAGQAVAGEMPADNTETGGL